MKNSDIQSAEIYYFIRAHKSTLMAFLVFLLLGLWTNQVHSEKRCARRDSLPIVAIGFYGISRGLQHTISSIERHVFDVLERHSIGYDVYWHTVVSPSIFNLHSVEKNLKLDEYDVRLVRPCHFSLSDESVLSTDEFFKYCNAKKMKCSAQLDKSHEMNNLWYEGFSDVKHLITSFSSQRILYRMIQRYSEIYNRTYDAIVAIRPDMAPIFDLDLPQYLSNISHNPAAASTLYIPDFQPFRGYNDRAAFGSYDAMAKYLLRGNQYVLSPQRFDIHSELFLQQYLDAKQVTVVSSDYRTVRVRANGCVDQMDTWHMNLNQNHLKVLELSQCFIESTNENGCPILTQRC
jgi:hypothetical protein